MKKTIPALFFLIFSSFVYAQEINIENLKKHYDTNNLKNGNYWDILQESEMKT